MSVKCPCCGSVIETKLPMDALLFAGFPPIASRAIEALIKAYPRTMTTSMLCDIVWANDPNGGPGDPDNVLAVSICKVNKKLRAFGWRIGAPKVGVRGQIGLRPVT